MTTASATAAWVRESSSCWIEFPAPSALCFSLSLPRPGWLRLAPGNPVLFFCCLPRLLVCRFVPFLRPRAQPGLWRPPWSLTVTLFGSCPAHHPSVCGLFRVLITNEIEHGRQQELRAAPADLHDLRRARSLPSCLIIRAQVCNFVLIVPLIGLSCAAFLRLAEHGCLHARPNPLLLACPACVSWMPSFSCHFCCHMRMGRSGACSLVFGCARLQASLTSSISAASVTR